MSRTAGRRAPRGAPRALVRAAGRLQRGRPAAASVLRRGRANVEQSAAAAARHWLPRRLPRRRLLLGPRAANRSCSRISAVAAGFEAPKHGAADPPHRARSPPTVAAQPATVASTTPGLPQSPPSPQTSCPESGAPTTAEAVRRRAAPLAAAAYGAALAVAAMPSPPPPRRRAEAAAGRRPAAPMPSAAESPRARRTRRPPPRAAAATAAPSHPISRFFYCADCPPNADAPYDHGRATLAGANIGANATAVAIMLARTAMAPATRCSRARACSGVQICRRDTAVRRRRARTGAKRRGTRPSSRPVVSRGARAVANA